MESPTGYSYGIWHLFLFCMTSIITFYSFVIFHHSRCGLGGSASLGGFLHLFTSRRVGCSDAPDALFVLVTTIYHRRFNTGFFGVSVLQRCSPLSPLSPLLEEPARLALRGGETGRPVRSL